jgi:hypothetical protein
MLDSLLTNFFVMCVYFIPGSILMFGILLIWPRLLPKNNSLIPSKWRQDIYLIFISLFLGVLIHAIMYSPFYIFHKQFWHVQQTIMNERGCCANTSSQDACQRLNINPFINEIDYYLAETMVKEKTNKAGETVYRLEALYYLCRNCVIPFFVLAYGITFRYRKRFTWKRFFMFGGSIVIGELVLIGSAFYYFSSMIYAVLRGIVLLPKP